MIFEAAARGSDRQPGSEREIGLEPAPRDARQHQVSNDCEAAKTREKDREELEASTHVDDGINGYLEHQGFDRVL
jgi:hypothetical protein